jgi:hypothetical protein
MSFFFGVKFLFLITTTESLFDATGPVPGTVVTVVVI